MRKRVPAVAVIAWAVSLSPVAAYYHYTHFTTQGVAVEKFDLNALPNHRVTFYVSDASPTQYGPNDSFPAVLSQVQQATVVWNSVDSSELRVAFGGLITVGTPQATPGGLVVFDDMQPGVMAFSTRTTSDATAGPDGPFVPIMQGIVHLNRNLSASPGPSYLESFFTTVVHEMGHALGLQHTFTSSAMSTGITRTTSRARPIEADDIAGISALYPGAGFRNGSFGSISGRVTSGGQGVSMASVVALRPSKPAVSTLTNPDGTYRIDGLPPDAYWLYVHPLPPTADILPPTDPTGQYMQPEGPTETLFYPGTKDPAQFAMINVGRGGAVTDIDFSVQKRASAPIYDVSTWGVLGQVYTPPFLDSTAQVGTLVASGNGLTAGSQAAPGLGVSVLGGFASTSFAAYGEPAVLAVYLYPTLLAGTGPRHLLFTLPDDIYVLPSAVNFVHRAPPAILGLLPNTDGTVAVVGSGMLPDSQIFFDGLPATVQMPFAGNDEMGAAVVRPPVGADGQNATVTVFNSDGQNSMFTQAQNPPVYAYGPSAQPFANFTPNMLPAGASAMIDVTGGNTHFADGQTTLGFGSSDVTVRRVWVLSPTHLVANVTVAGNAPAGILPASVISGFQVTQQPGAFQVQPPNPALPSIALPLLNALPNQNGVFPGAAVSIYGTNLALTPASIMVTLNDQPVQVLYASPTQVNILVPQGFPTGPAVLKLNNGAVAAYPVMVEIDPPPPVITAIMANTFSAGDVVNIFLTGLDPSIVTAPGRLRVNIAGSNVTPFAVSPVVGQPGVLQAQVYLPPVAPGPAVAVTVTLAGTGATSAPFSIAVN